MAELEPEIERLEREDAWDAGDTVIELEVEQPLDKVISIRLSADKWETLREEARESGVGPATLARIWILERLREATLGRKLV